MNRTRSILLKTQCILLFTIQLSLLLSCKKEEVTNKSHALILLQNKWTPFASWIFLPNGSQYQLIPSISQTFTSDGKIIEQHYITTSSGSEIEESVIGKYLLLPDDSTLLFYNVNSDEGTGGDTAIIRTLTDNLLVYYYRKDNFIQSIDSLKR